MSRILDLDSIEELIGTVEICKRHSIPLNADECDWITDYKPTQEYYILFELIKYCRLPATFSDIGITVISEGSEPSQSDVSVTQDVLMDIKKEAN